ILLAGCTSPNLSDVYLLSLSYNTDSNRYSSPYYEPVQYNLNMSRTFTYLAREDGHAHPLEIRAGFLGLCMKRSTTTSSAYWFCSPHAQVLLDGIKEPGSTITDPLNLIWISQKFKDRVVFSGLTIASIPFMLLCFFALSSFPGWDHVISINGENRHIKFSPAKPAIYTAMFFAWISSLFVFLAVFGQQVLSSAGVALINDLSYGTIEAHTGPTAMGLGWGAMICTLFVFFGVLLIIISIAVLDNKKKEEDG
ncbi:hypothetical protein FQN51_005706, partial [Onygenales sp. PD_10]